MKALDSNSPLVSVVIPIFNVSQYIGRGLQNILSQQYQNFEIILVDDGSTDNSGLLCDQWAKENSKIRVFHKKNEGAGSARNVGIIEAKGEYIYFFDIDDKADADLLAYNVQIMEEKKVDYILFGFRTVIPSLNNTLDEIRFKECEIHSNEELKNIYVDTFVLSKHGNGFPWNKFYRRSFLLKHHLLFENQRIQQDEVFNLNLYPYLERAYISPKILYTYYIYDQGNTRVRFIPDRFDIYVSVREHFEKLMHYWNLNDQRMEDYLDQRFFTGVLQCCCYNLFHKNCYWSNNEKREEIVRILNHPYTQKAMALRLSRNLSYEERLYLFLINKCLLKELRIVYKTFSLLHYIKRCIR